MSPWVPVMPGLPDESRCEVRRSGSWRPVLNQFVVAKVDGKIRRVEVTEWNPFTNAVRVAWPRDMPSTVSLPVSQVRTTEIAEARYEPLDPTGFKAATKGSLTK